MSSATIGSALGAAFLASFVEAVEALTIVLAVGLSRGWRPALSGAGLALLALAALVALLGPLLGLIPIGLLQYAVGVLLILFGLRCAPRSAKSSACSSMTLGSRCFPRWSSPSSPWRRNSD